MQKGSSLELTIVVSLRDGFHIYLKNAQRNVCRKKLTDFRRGGRPRPPGSGVFPFSGTSGEFGRLYLALPLGELARHLP